MRDVSVGNVTSPPSWHTTTQLVRRNLLFAMFCVLALLLFLMPLTTLCRLSLQQDVYSQALLILPISLGVLYVERKRIFFDVCYCFWLGTVLVLAGVMLYWLDEKYLPHLSQNDHLSLAVFSFIIVSIGGFVLSYGSKAFRAALFPLCFLLLMVPIPGFLLERIVLALQRGSAEVTYALFRLSGVPVFRQGFTFSLAGVTIEIAQECSGIRSTLALFITSLLAGHVFLRSTRRRVFLSVFAIAMGIVKNGVRIVTLSLLGVYVDSGFLTGRLHHRYGGTVFTPLALAVLVPVLWLLQKSESNVQNPRSRGEHTKGRFVPEME